MTKVKQWFVKYKHYLSLGLFVGGFIFDNIALKNADFPVIKLALFSYLVFIGAAIILFNLITERAAHRPRLTWLAIWLRLLIQFAFGNIFSGFFVLYFYSAPVIISWPFLAVLFLVFLSSEFGKKHYLRFSFQLVVFYLAVYSFVILFAPIVLGELSARVFLLSGFVSLAVMSGFLAIASWSAPKLFELGKKRLAWGIGGTFVLLNIFYFTNILPPIPLVIKDSRVYHSISRSGNGFVAEDEERSWWSNFSFYPTIHLTASGSAYFYGAVFAPTALKTGVVHRWEYFNESDSAWVETNRVSIPIIGGREAGFRTYSAKSSMASGLWRVSIETKRGQVIGRQKFKVVRVNQAPILEPKTL